MMSEAWAADSRSLRRNPLLNNSKHFLSATTPLTDVAPEAAPPPHARLPQSDRSTALSVPR